MLRRTLAGPTTKSWRTNSAFLRHRFPHLATRGSSLSPSLRPESTLANVASREEEGSIASVFSSLSGDAFVPLEQRFSDLKRSLWNDGLIESWRDVLQALKTRTEEIRELGNAVIPQVSFNDLGSLSSSTISEIKRVGTVLIHDAVSEQEALDWKREIQDYIAKNRSLAKGFPSEDPQVWEIYNSVAQTKARTHPNLLASQRFLLSLFHTSDPESPVSTTTPVSYYDRLRIRFPGDSVFALGPHIDGGSLERWEDPGFRSCFSEVLKGGSDPHVRLDSWDLSPRLNANTDLYNGAGQCSVFRMFQGWTSLSRTGPSEGTLQVFPDIDLATSYLILRPFFKPKRGRETRLGFEDWELDLDSTSFPGSVKGKGQELSPQTHPHLSLETTMTSIPRVVPGSQAYWHTDVVHSVESNHSGSRDSSVFYIPAVPLTENVAEYLKDQRQRFLEGLPPKDFPQGIGEQGFVGRAARTTQEMIGNEGRTALGFQEFVAGENETNGGRKVIQRANDILFG